MIVPEWPNHPKIYADCIGLTYRDSRDSLLVMLGLITSYSGPAFRIGTGGRPERPRYHMVVLEKASRGHTKLHNIAADTGYLGLMEWVLAWSYEGRTAATVWLPWLSEDNLRFIRGSTLGWAPLLRRNAPGLFHGDKYEEIWSGAYRARHPKIPAFSWDKPLRSARAGASK